VFLRSKTIADCRLPIADCRLPIADCRLPIAACRLPLADGLIMASGGYEVVLLNLLLPDGDGGEVIDRLRSERSLVPIIVPSARGDERRNRLHLTAPRKPPSRPRVRWAV
jgi:CheY-like chemotaxis protein